MIPGVGSSATVRCKSAIEACNSYEPFGPADSAGLSVFGAVAFPSVVAKDDLAEGASANYTSTTIQDLLQTSTISLKTKEAESNSLYIVPFASM